MNPSFPRDGVSGKPGVVQLARELNLLEVKIDDGSLINTKGTDLQKIAGQAIVTYSEDGESVAVSLP